MDKNVQRLPSVRVLILFPMCPAGNVAADVQPKNIARLLITASASKDFCAARGPIHVSYGFLYSVLPLDLVLPDTRVVCWQGFPRS